MTTKTTSATVSETVVSATTNKENTMNTTNATIQTAQGQFSTKVTIIRDNPILPLSDLKMFFTDKAIYAAFDEGVLNHKRDSALENQPGQVLVPAWNEYGCPMNESNFKGATNFLMHAMEDYEFVGYKFIVKDAILTSGIQTPNLAFVGREVLFGLFPGASIIGADSGKPDAVFNVGWSGQGFYAVEIVYVKAEKGEHDDIMRMRRTLRLFAGSQIFFTAWCNKNRVKMAWSDKVNYAGKGAYIQKMYEAKSSGDIESLKDMSSAGRQSAKIWSETGKAITRAADGIETVVEYINKFPMGEIEVSEAIIGKRFLVYRGSKAGTTVTMNEKHYKEQCATINKFNMTVQEIG